jgi:general secretion pathway protein A
MYQAFFKLTRNPFEVSPDPYFLYPTAQHKEALAGLYYGIKARKGFMVLTGEVGTGKSLVVRCLQDLLDKQRVAYAYVFNTRLSSRHFLEYVAEDLGAPPGPSSKSDLLIRLNRHLIERHRQGLATVLVVDEAQHLGFVVLEEIRLLTNLETAQGKLLQIVLVGQPELDAKVDDPALRQLKQRIAHRFQLRVLSEPETSSYVQCRLKLAGDKTGDIFAPPALERVHFYSGGVPRLINILCDNAMLSAFALDETHITTELIDESASDLRLTGVNGNGAKPAATLSGSERDPAAEQEGSVRAIAPVDDIELADAGPVPSASSEGDPAAEQESLMKIIARVDDTELTDAGPVPSADSEGDPAEEQQTLAKIITSVDDNEIAHAGQVPSANSEGDPAAVLKSLVKIIAHVDDTEIADAGQVPSAEEVQS